MKTTRKNGLLQKMKTEFFLSSEIKVNAQLIIKQQAGKKREA